jgi:predicted AAA+ superfamily ATPase
MRNIPKDQILSRISFENPWWSSGAIDPFYAALTPRAYFPQVRDLVTERRVRRAVILMGPRRVGKTVLLHHVIRSLIEGGAVPQRVCFISVDAPVYTGHSLAELIGLVREHNAAIGDDLAGAYFFFDEIQYLRDWEQHLKSLVDSYPKAKFVVSGSSAAALRLKSNESGAGRFTDFLLPPLTFHEYLMLSGETGLVRVEGPKADAVDLPRLNEKFIEYLNFGGYPEVALSAAIRADASRYVRNDIIDKVLLRDLPSLYGIADIQELNSLFTTLAFNTAGEVSLENLSQRAGIAKNTIKRYIEYLEAAFLVRRVTRIDDNARRFQRATHFKIYLTNPSLRAALFAPIGADDADMGDMVETAVFAQWFHSTNAELRYARWKTGEIDIIALDAGQRPQWAVECKWSDRYAERPDELEQLVGFCRRHDLTKARITTRSVTRSIERDGVRLHFLPASLYCYQLGYNIVQGGPLRA